MEPFAKTVRLGLTRESNDECWASVFCRIEWDGKRLSIQGVEGPRKGGNAVGGCGQIVLHSPTIEKLAPGWTGETVERFWDMWRKWHLNDMQAACEHQRARGETWQTHPSAVCPDCGYSLGSKWLYMEVPEEVLQWFKDLPDTDVIPVWV